MIRICFNRIVVLSFLTLFFPLDFFAQKISPLDYGLMDAKSGIERYQILLKTHSIAIEKGLTIDYTGIDRLDIEIPKDGVSIPLGNYTDFKGITINVTNNSKNIYLFQMTQELIPISISKQDFNTLHYLSRDEFKGGNILLVIKDKTPWVKNRIGYSYGAIRKDILLISNSEAVNTPIMPYDTPQSQPCFSYCNVDEKEKFIGNITVNRVVSSTYKTRCFLVENQNKVTISNVIVNTPQNTLYGDAAISFQNCTNSLLKDIIINGTYSQLKRYGYGVMFDNVWNTTVLRMKGDGQWGIFGNNNVNVARLRECRINRFDIHCYGRDIDFENCVIFRLYNQYSSVYGTISHRNCIFDAAIPCLLGSSYNAYTPFNLLFENCVIRMNTLHNEVIYIMEMPNRINERIELKKKCLPNLNLNNCKIEFKEPVNEWYILKSKSVKGLPVSVGYISQISLNKLDIGSGTGIGRISNIDISTDSLISYDGDGLSLELKKQSEISPVVFRK